VARVRAQFTEAFLHIACLFPAKRQTVNELVPYVFFGSCFHNEGDLQTRMNQQIV
jgi:hypothetical protein